MNEGMREFKEDERRMFFFQFSSIYLNTIIFINFKVVKPTV